MNIAIQVTDAVNEQMALAVGQGLAAFNDAFAGYDDRRALNVVVTDRASGEAQGGILGRTSLGVAFLETFYLPEKLRGSGVGSNVLKAFEDEAGRRGCTAAVLYTMAFQAPGFYERHGWHRFGEVPCKPDGNSRVFMRKALRAV
jgi:GNAT superfamily N-acetyltransferase